MPTWTDKLLQEVIRSILDAYYEPQFSHFSHGFRPGRGCHTALQHIVTKWTGTRWFIEGDIAACFDRLDHTVMLNILRERIHDNRFLRLIETVLQAGYLEDWRYHATRSGSPQGGVVSPILSNIYLNKLDEFVVQTLLPTYTRGTARRRNKRYRALQQQVRLHRQRGQWLAARRLRKQLQRLPSTDPQDPGYRRLRYVRYADDWLLGFSGPRAEAEEIKRRLGEFLHTTLKLELSQDKTLLTHATTHAARFLGYEIVNQYADDQHDRHGRRSLNGSIGLRLPLSVLEQKCASYCHRNRPAYRAALFHDTDFSILSRYQAEYRGLVQYYLLAHNVSWLWKLHWVMKQSLLKTLAAKHQTSVARMARKYRATTQTPHGVLQCLQVTVARRDKPPLVARFGGLPLRRRKEAFLDDQLPLTMSTPRNELIKRLLADRCELCGSQEHCQVHHIRKLADLKVKGRREKPVWVQVMAARRRKTLVVCRACHVAIHAGRPTPQPSRTEDHQRAG